MGEEFVQGVCSLNIYGRATSLYPQHIYWVTRYAYDSATAAMIITTLYPSACTRLRYDNNNILYTPVIAVRINSSHAKYRRPLPATGGRIRRA